MELLPIQNKIYEVRGERIMFDFDLALLFDTETRTLKQSVKRNIALFPTPFMLTLTQIEWSEVITNCDNLPSNIRFTPSLPFAFTEHGVTMLASILKSERAIKMNIAIVTAFIEMKKQLTHYSELAQKIHTMEQQNNTQFLEIYEALENLINDTQQLKEKNKKRTTWEQRETIGFKKTKN
jgi:phage regulator Rha-like protein